MAAATPGQAPGAPAAPRAPWAPGATGSGEGTGAAKGTGESISISNLRAAGAGVTEACSTALVTISDTSRQARSAWSGSISHEANVAAATRRASETMIGSAG